MLIKSVFTKHGANALSQCGAFMEEPPECLTDSVDLGPEGCSVRGEGFELCLSLKLDVREYTLKLSDSVSNLSLHFSVVCFCQFSMHDRQNCPLKIKVLLISATAHFTVL